jgi:hypothetical protein
MIVVVGEWEDDMMRANNNFKIGLANKTMEKLTMGVLNCPPSFTGFRLKQREGGVVLIHGGEQWQKMAGQGRSFPIK